MDNSATIIAILGAGSATRFGGGKLDADLRGQALGLAALRVAEQVGAGVIYVTGPQAPRFLAAVDHRAKLIVNERPEQGMGRSLALAAAQARMTGAQRLLVMLGDMPFVSGATLQRLCDAVGPGGAAACRYPDGTLGPPACFDGALFAELERLDGDHGARGVLGDPQRTIALAVDPDELRDVDRPEELAALNRD